MKDAMHEGFGPDLGTFDWQDPFRLADQLNEDQRMLAEAAAIFAQDKLMPRVITAYAEERVEPEIFAAILYGWLFAFLAKALGDVSIKTVGLRHWAALR